MNIYAYAGGDPVNGRDPSGMAAGCTAASLGLSTSGTWTLPSCPSQSEVDNALADIVVNGKSVKFLIDSLAPPIHPDLKQIDILQIRPFTQGPAQNVKKQAAPKPQKAPVTKPTATPREAKNDLCRLSKTASGAGSILGHIATVSLGAALIPNPLSPELGTLSAFTGGLGGALSLGGAVGEYFTCSK